MGHCNEIFGSNESRVPESVTVMNQRGEIRDFFEWLVSFTFIPDDACLKLELALFVGCTSS
jgi:hypothetical protein